MNQIPHVVYLRSVGRNNWMTYFLVKKAVAANSRSTSETKTWWNHFLTVPVLFSYNSFSMQQSNIRLSHANLVISPCFSSVLKGKSNSLPWPTRPRVFQAHGICDFLFPLPKSSSCNVTPKLTTDFPHRNTDGWLLHIFRSQPKCHFLKNAWTALSI